MADTGFEDGEVVLYSMTTGKILHQWLSPIQRHQTWITSSDLSADGKRILTLFVIFAQHPPAHSSGEQAAYLQMHNAQTGKLLWSKALKRPSTNACAHFVLGDTKILVLNEKRAIICQASDGKTLIPWRFNHPMDKFAVSPDGKTAAITGVYESGLYSIPDGHLLKSIGEEGELIDFFYAPNGDLLEGIGDVQILAAKSVRLIRTLPWFTRPIVAATAASPDGQTYAMVAELPGTGPFLPPKSLLILFDANTGMVRRQISLVDTWRASVEFSADSRKIACGTDRNWYLFNIGTGDLVSASSRIATRNESVGMGPVHFSPDGSTLFAAESDNTTASDNTIVFRSTTTGKVVKTIALPSGVRFDQFALSPDGQTLAITARNGDDNHATFDIELWDVTQQRRIRVLSPSPHIESTVQSTYSPLLFSPDGKTLVVGDFASSVPSWLRHVDGALDLYSIPDGIKRATIPDFGQQQTAFSPDSKTLFTASGAAWDVNTAHALWQTTPNDLHNNLLTISINPTGQGDVLTSANLDLRPDFESRPAYDDSGRMMIRDAKTGKEKATIYLLPLKETSSGLEAEWLTVTPDGYYCGSPGVSQWIRWRSGTTLLSAGALDAQRNSPERVQQALK